MISFFFFFAFAIDFHILGFASVPHQSLSGDGFRLSVNKTVRPVRRKCQSGWGSHSGGPAMTEYTVKEIGHQWIVYADRLSIAACADEASALKLFAEDSAANHATRKSTVLGISTTLADFCD